MLEYQSLGPTPAGEDCVQVGDPDYANKASKECSRYRALLKMKFPQAGAHGCKFVRQAFTHDFGTYYEISIQFDDSRLESCEFAYFVEGNIPEFWTDTKVEEFASDLEEANA